MTLPSTPSLSSLTGCLLLALSLLGAGCGTSPSTEGDSDEAGTLAQCEDAPTDDELRGVWITNVDSKVLDSRDNIEEAMAFLEDHNFNTVFPVVWNDAATMYPSAVMDTLIGRRIDPAYEGRDPLREIVDAAHEHDLAVIPWFEFGFASSYRAQGGRILDKYPQWAARTSDDSLVTKNGFDWMNGLHPGPQRLLLNLIREVAENYDVDGIQGDDRLPAMPVEAGYSDFTTDLYASEHDGTAPPDDPENPDWKQWRADKLSDFGEHNYNEVKAVDSSLVVSWSPSPYPFGYDEYLQDWPAWIDRGITDLVHPQVYRRDVDEYKDFLSTQRADELGWDRDDLIGFFPGVLMKVGDYRMTPEDLVEVIVHNRQQGLTGEVFFFYEGLRDNGDELANVLKSCYSEPATLPFEPAHVP